MSGEYIVHPLDPIFDQNSRVLILGSFPSVKSREMHFYYANPHNRFWPVMEAVFHEQISDKEAFCHKHHIALWDVIHSCTIHASSDSSIDHVEPNDLTLILQDSSIRTIFTTGRKADELYRKFFNFKTEHIALPSTSSANARMSLDDLARIYLIIREKTHEE